MRFLRVYGRALGILGRDLRVAALADRRESGGRGIAVPRSNAVRAGGQPAVASDQIAPDEPWTQAAGLPSPSGPRLASAAIVEQVMVSRPDRAAGASNRLKVMGRYFSHVLTLPPVLSRRHAFRASDQDDGLRQRRLFGTWLVFFRDQLATLISALVLLPLTLLLNWRLALRADRAGLRVLHGHRVRDPQDGGRAAPGRELQLLPGGRRTGRPGQRDGRAGRLPGSRPRRGSSATSRNS